MSKKIDLTLSMKLKLDLNALEMGAFEILKLVLPFLVLGFHFVVSHFARHGR